MSRQVILYISMSLDGYIAAKDDDLSFLDAMQVKGEDYGYSEFTQTIDTYIVGRKTYDTVKALLGGDFPQAQRYDCYVITRQNLEERDGVTFYNGDLAKLISDLRSKPGKNIYCDGGGEVVKLMVEKGLIDVFIISIIPVLLGSGKRLFLENHAFQNLSLKTSKAFPSGLVQVRYEKQSVELRN